MNDNPTMTQTKFTDAELSLIIDALRFYREYGVDLDPATRDALADLAEALAKEACQ